MIQEYRENFPHSIEELSGVPKYAKYENGLPKSDKYENGLPKLDKYEDELLAQSDRLQEATVNKNWCVMVTKSIFETCGANPWFFKL